MMTLISWVNRIYGLVSCNQHFQLLLRKLHEMPGNTLKLSGKVREKPGNFIWPNLLLP